ncbi:sensor histidine kinase [Flavicella sediminum]|uniref:sensor histidine kinase n=1 Tax=Flavicella sediminum TaxID=2585141 RepID=UPI0011243336|nr:HAMP domain-containing sensor histidine kinase [Flavicella sediminum]
MFKNSIPAKFYRPYIVSLFSIIASLIIYNVFHYFFHLVNYNQGLYLAIGAPFIVSFPISLIAQKHLNKIYQQKIELEKLNELNNKLFSIIAHDIRGPLSIVKGYVEILQDVQKNLFAKEDLKYLQNLSNKVNHLLLFLDDLLQWSKNQIDNSPVIPTEFNLKELIMNSIEIYEETRISKNQELETQITDFRITTDKEALGFTLRNLYYNAIKFTPKGGHIYFYTQKTEKEIRISIEDNGIGISDAHLDTITKSKEWFSTQGTNNEVGTGFGIKTSIQYLELQNGKLEIETSLKKGTKVTVVLPTNN